jgi:sirohydrochlorin cobaltochelatase
MIRAAGVRIEEALKQAGDSVPLHDTLLVVVGRGASDPDANSNVAKVARMLWEGFGFGWAETAYSGVTFPLVEPALEKAARLGFRRIVAFPYFLFTGILVQRIYDAADAVAARHPDIEFVKAPYLNDHPLVLETFVDRVREILEGQNLMNCALCKYREQILGFEAEVGLPQESHHHHVEGIWSGEPPALRPSGEEVPDEAFDAEKPLPNPSPQGGGASASRTVLHYNPHSHAHGHHHHDHDHPFDHGHAHDHDHGHFPYPHADHPLGPRSLKRK